MSHSSIISLPFSLANSDMNETGASTWDIGHIPLPRPNWNRSCQFCGIQLLSGEKQGFCCGSNGKFANTPPSLPPFPPEFDWLVKQNNISTFSRKLNILFSFASMETERLFPQLSGGNSFVSIQGRVYHRLRPDHPKSGLRWLLYDGWDAEEIPNRLWLPHIPRTWVTATTNALLRENPFAKQLLFVFTLPQEDFPDAHIILEDRGTAEIAAILHYDTSVANNYSPRSMVIARHSGDKVQIATTSRLWEPLAYPLFFPAGTLGWGLIDTANDYRHNESHDMALQESADAPTTQIWYYRARLLREPRFQIFGRLANEYLVDMWTREIDCRLAYIRSNQIRIRQEDAELMGVDEVDSSSNVYLPSSFLGGHRWSSEQVSDALAIASYLGPPTFFVTITANPEWPEIQSCLRPGQSWADIPMVVVRVFHSRLVSIIKAISELFPNAGRPIYKIHVIEFQKRGLPHCHLLLKFREDCINPADIDKVVSAELPEDKEDAELVKIFMRHTHKLATAPRLNACQKLSAFGQLSCKYGYPQPLQNATTIDKQGRPHYRRRKEGDQMIVPYCLKLLRKFQCHINFEVANTSHLFQYLFKYIHKGPDRARYIVGFNESIDEINDYLDGRYVSAGEAAWRILGYHVAHKYPSVQCLPVHLVTSRAHYQYIRQNGQQSKLSLLNRYFLRPKTNYVDSNGEYKAFDDLTYPEYYRVFRLVSLETKTNLPCYLELPPSIEEVCLQRRMYLKLTNS